MNVFPPLDLPFVSSASVMSISCEVPAARLWRLARLGATNRVGGILGAKVGGLGGPGAIATTLLLGGTGGPEEVGVFPAVELLVVIDLGDSESTIRAVKGARLLGA